VPTGFPFAYFGEGLAAARKSMGLIVAFARPPARRRALAKLPSVFTHVTWLSAAVVEVVHVGALEGAVARTYPKRGPRAEDGEATVEQWKRFNRAIDRWLIDAHGTDPVRFVIKPADEEYGTAFGRWHRWSSLEVGPSGGWQVIAAALPRRRRGALAWVLEQWRADLAQLSPEKQDKAIARLDRSARAFLRRRGGVPRVTAPPPGKEEAPLETRLDVWRALKGKEGDREEQYRQRLDVPVDEPNPSLWGLALDLVAVERFADAAEVCLDALRGPVEYRDHWTGLAIYTLARARRFDDVRARLGEAFVAAALYGAAHLMTGLVLWLEHEGRNADACAAFHGAAKSVASFEPRALELGLDPKRYGRRSRKHLARWPEIWEEILRTSIDVETLPAHLLHAAEQNLREVGGLDLAEEIAREEARRAGPPPAPVARPHLPLLEKEAEGAGDDDFRAALDLLPSLGEREADALLDWAYAAVGDDGSRARALYGALPKLAVPEDRELRRAWLSRLNNAAVMTWREKNLALSRALVEAAAPFAHEHPAIHHAAACTYVALGELELAFIEVGRAVEHGYDGLGRLKRDADLGELREWPRFKSLFAARRA